MREAPRHPVQELRPRSAGRERVLVVDVDVRPHMPLPWIAPASSIAVATGETPSRKNRPSISDMRPSPQRWTSGHGRRVPRGWPAIAIVVMSLWGSSLPENAGGYGRLLGGHGGEEMGVLEGELLIAPRPPEHREA